MSQVSQVDDTQLRSAHLYSFIDVSHAPYRFNDRKGISGGAVFFERSLVGCLSRQQQASSLSSCEAELYGLQSVCQESVEFEKLVHSLLFALHEIDEPEEELYGLRVIPAPHSNLFSPWMSHDGLVMSRFDCTGREHKCVMGC